MEQTAKPSSNYEELDAFVINTISSVNIGTGAEPERSIGGQIPFSTDKNLPSIYFTSTINVLCDKCAKLFIIDQCSGILKIFVYYILMILVLFFNFYLI